MKKGETLTSGCLTVLCIFILFFSVAFHLWKDNVALQIQERQADQHADQHHAEQILSKVILQSNVEIQNVNKHCYIFCTPFKDIVCFTWTDSSHITHVISTRMG